MFKSYLIIAIRNLFRQKMFSFVNILGLAIGMTCFLLIGMNVRMQLNFDTFHKKGDRIYRFIRTMGLENGPYSQATTGANLAPLLKDESPEIEQVVRLGRWEGKVQFGDRQFEEFFFLFSDAEIFDVFSFRLLQGDPHIALRDPFSVLVTEGTAKRYFGNENPIGKVLRYTNKQSNHSYDFTVTGIIEVPQNSHIRLNFLASMNSLAHVDFVSDRYFSQGRGPCWTYVLLNKGANPHTLMARMPSFVERHIDKGAASWVKVELEPLNRIYLHSRADSKLSGDLGSVELLYFISFLGFAVLAIACINFMNLSTARATFRAKEVGVRKVFGGQRSNLICQFLTESLIMSILAFVLSLMFIELIGGLDRNLSFAPDYLSLLFGILTTAVVGFFNGIYPALLLSGFDPVQTLKGRLRIGSASGFRKALIVFQFVVSIALIVVTFVAFQQVHYGRYKDLGFNQHHIITLEIRHASVRKKYDAFRMELLKDPRILGITGASAQIGMDFSGVLNLRGNDLERDQEMDVIWISPDFTSVMGLHLIEGEDVTAGSTRSVILNQLALEKLEWTGAVGKPIEFFSRRRNDIRVLHTGQVAGVVKDFRYHIFRMRPLALILDPDRANYILIRAYPNQMRTVVPHIEALWKNWFPDQRFEYAFLDERIDLPFHNFEKIIGLFSIINVLTIFIACLGLFGLTAYTIDRRIKEIGIRKVMGATVWNISALLSKEFVGLVGIAAAIACPIVFVVLDFVLNRLPDQTKQSPIAYVLGVGIVLLIALLTVNMLIVRAARTNPADALRNE